MQMFFCQSIRISYTLQHKTHIVLQDLTRVVEEAESEGMEVDLWMVGTGGGGHAGWGEEVPHPQQTRSRPLHHM